MNRKDLVYHVLCQFVSPRRRVAGYGLMNMTGNFSVSDRSEKNVNESWIPVVK
jgi:hypothetical protein